MAAQREEVVGQVEDARVPLQGHEAPAFGRELTAAGFREICSMKPVFVAPDAGSAGR